MTVLVKTNRHENDLWLWMWIVAGLFLTSWFLPFIRIDGDAPAVLVWQGVLAIAHGDISAHTFGIGLRLTLFECMALPGAILLAWIPHCIALLMLAKLKRRASWPPSLGLGC